MAAPIIVGVIVYLLLKRFETSKRVALCAALAAAYVYYHHQQQQNIPIRVEEDSGQSRPQEYSFGSGDDTDWIYPVAIIGGDQKTKT